MKTFVHICIISFFGMSHVYSQHDHNAAATTTGAYGRVEFANSGSRAAQTDFLAGMALLHDFEYAAAAQAFQRAEAADPGFALAYWGEAMTFNHPIWMQQDLNAGRAALNKLAPTPEERRTKAKTEREKAYLDAVEVLYGEGTKEERDGRYEAAMAVVHARFPDDVDAAAFYGLAILGTAHAGRDIATYMRAARVLEEAWIDHREHPGLVHYLIHSYDDPEHAPLGLRAARIYARIAPDAGHAQHMTSHIFLALGMWPEVVQANIAAIAVVNKGRKANGKLSAGCGHYPSWLAYGYLQLGQMDKAKSAVAECRTELESSTVAADTGKSMDPDRSLAGSYANMRLRYLIDSGSLTDDGSTWVTPKASGAGARLDYQFARVINEVRQGHHSEAAAALKDLEAVAREAIDIETKNAEPDPTYRVRPEIFRLEAQAMVAELDKDFPGAERLLTEAVALEEKLPIAFGPPTIDKPTHELLGEFLQRRGRKAEAHREFEKALARTPGRRLAQEGFAATRP